MWGAKMSVLWEFVEDNLKKHQNSVIEEYNFEKYTYGELLCRIESYANRMRGMDLRQKKCVIVCEKNIKCLEYMIFCWKVGMIPIPVSLHYGIEHCRKIISVTEPDYVLTDKTKVELAYDTKIYDIESFIGHFEIITKKEPELVGIELMMCTSGTTGLPKASMFTGEAIEKNVYAITDYFPLLSSDTILVARPLYHCAVLVGEVLTSICVGSSILFFSEKYNPLVLSKIIKKSNVTALCGTPTLLKGLADIIKNKDSYRKIRLIALSGEYLLQEYSEIIATTFSEAKVFNVYGLTEAGPRVSYLDSILFKICPQSVGTPLKNVEIVILPCDYSTDKEFDSVEEGEVGLVWIKTPCLMKGYYRDKAKTIERIHGEWFNTGDMGYVKENRLYIIGRSDDMIIRAGMNLYPKEIEVKMLELSEITEVMVYGEIIDGIEQIFADVVLSDSSETVTEYEIKQKLVKNIPGYMLPYKINIVSALPRNASGKVVRPTKKIRECR